MKPLYLLLALCSLVQGCVGGGLLKSRTTVYSDPVVPVSPDAGVVRQRDRGDLTNNVVYTSGWLRSHWGEPKTVRHAANGGPEQTWTYQVGLKWRGVVPIVVVPLPLVVPIGRERVQFALNDGHVVRASETAGHMTGGFIGFGFGPCGPAGFGAYSLSHMDD